MVCQAQATGCTSYHTGSWKKQYWEAPRARLVRRLSALLAARLAPKSGDGLISQGKATIRYHYQNHASFGG